MSLNQTVLQFIMDYFGIDLASPSKPKEKQSQRRVSKKPNKPLFATQIVIVPTYAMLSYTSQNLSLKDLPSQPLEFLNFINLTYLRVKIPAFELS